LKSLETYRVKKALQDIKLICHNINHRRTNASVRCCPMCGRIVNENITKVKCTEDNHAKKRLRRSQYCVDCGEQLIRWCV